MFRAILFTQWKWLRLPLLPAVIVAFALPLLSVQSPGGGPGVVHPAYLLSHVEAWSVWFPVLAAGLGLLAASTAWGADHRGGHVYALSLPIPRWRYVLLRFAAGLLLLVAPVLTLWIGGAVASGLASIPPGLRAYPHALALRFALAAALAYALFFAVSAGTSRTAAIVLSLVGGLVAAHWLLRAGGVDVNLVGLVFERLATSPGPLEIFTGRWMLINV